MGEIGAARSPTAMDDDAPIDLAAEMAALGLPSSFIAGLGHSPSTSRKSRRKPLSSFLSPADTDDKRESCTLTADSRTQPDESIPQANFRVRSVRLYTPNYPEFAVEECDGLDCSIEAQLDTSLIDGDVENVPLVATDVLGGLEESCVVENEDVRWEAVWDEQYECYYFCNTQSWESTWDPPPGFENYAVTGSLATDQHTSSLVDTQEKSFGVVCGEGIPAEGVRDSGSSVPGLVELRADQKEGRLSPVEKVEAMADYEEEFNGCRSETTDLNVNGSFLAEIQFQPGISNSHIRFRDSDESDGCSAQEEQDGGVDWKEMREEMPGQFRSENGVEEERDGFEACSSSSQHLVSSFDSKVRPHIKASKLGVKKRRLRSRSEGDQSNKVQLPGMVEMMSKNLVKYWIQRYSLFTKFDEGVKMDEEGWFSVTPEIIAKHQASRCVTGLVIDAFTGVGGNAIQFALKCYRVIAIDINPIRIECARHNAEIYGVSDKIEYIVGDFFQLAPFLKADLVFLSPPWGGPEYLKQDIYDLQTMLQPKDAITLFKVAQSIAPNIALFVPRNVDLNQIHELSWLTSPPLPFEVEKNYVNDKLKAITAYYGDIAGQEF